MTLRRYKGTSVLTAAFGTCGTIVLEASTSRLTAQPWTFCDPFPLTSVSDDCWSGWQLPLHHCRAVVDSNCCVCLTNASASSPSAWCLFTRCLRCHHRVRRDFLCVCVCGSDSFSTADLRCFLHLSFSSGPVPFIRLPISLPLAATTQLS